MQTKTETLTVGTNHLTGQARYFYLVECANAVDVTFVMQRNGGTEKAEGIRQGYWFEAPELITEIIVESDTVQDFKWAYTNGRGGYDRDQLAMAQGVTITNAAPVTVGNTVAVLVRAANSTDKGIAIRSDDSNTDRIAIGGAGVTFANAVHIIEPGEVFSDDNAAHAAFYAISESAAGQVVRVETRA